MNSKASNLVFSSPPDKIKEKGIWFYNIIFNLKNFVSSPPYWETTFFI